MLRVAALNREKENILEGFLIEIEHRRGSNWDMQQYYLSEVNPKLARIGGKISGQTRQFKHTLITQILSQLINNHLELFSAFSCLAMSFFSLNLLGVCPTKKSILSLIKPISDKKRLTENGQGVEDKVKELFEHHLTNQVLIKELFDMQMLHYQQQVQALSEESRAAYLQIKQELNNQKKEE
ncbi:hypothetical protein [Vibrio mytili]|uniref:Uncharacterized protein n=1 Tax=Vibrio mytili TaxID=50718 RepID=A0A0C3HQY0_9VIBR|nr:hypothetical protein [Vibrio mytili]KIN10551.1 hypothetical protein SU60_13120 [Vibrio mytili]